MITCLAAGNWLLHHDGQVLVWVSTVYPVFHMTLLVNDVYTQLRNPVTNGHVV